MIHGLFGSAALFRQKTGAIRKLCRRLLYTYVDAPLLVDSNAEKDNRVKTDSVTPSAIYAWFRHTSADLPVSAQLSLCSSTACWTCRPIIIHDFELGLIYFRKVMVETNPACIVCFSQGATIALTAILLDLLDTWEKRGNVVRYLTGVKSIILASPWVPHPCQLNSCDEPQQGNPVTDVLVRVARSEMAHKADLQLPFRVLVIYGSMDSVTPPSGIAYLRSICPFFRYVEHPNGHLIPTTEPVRTALRDEFESATTL
ncbi:Hypothetical protein GLP15_1585 [Giardia lamblia P15]|uniref:Serine hydrolase domain-containing protein n=1 Tax=Giardia intestinalis (strain P15) TaxID=658858 RepID=E1EXG6_GIAIA|nr:Hypothetical protein GLP15_1585 [Giardia lamblia P15]